MALEHEELTHAIIGAAIEVHKEVGPGFVEPFYHRALIIALRKRGIAFDTELHAPVFFQGHEIGRHRVDLLVEGVILVELKAVSHLDDVHFGVVRSYLRALDLEHGLLLNFSKIVLEVKRVIATARR